MFYRKKPVVVEARQWDGIAEHEAVERHFGELIYSKNGTHFYLSHPKLEGVNQWLPVDEEKEDVLPFAFYEVKSGRRVPLNELTGADLAIANRALAKFNPVPTLDQLKPWGYIKTLEGDMQVNVGDWVIKGTCGEWYPCKQGPFADTFEPAKFEPTPRGESRFAEDGSLFEISEARRALRCLQLEAPAEVVASVTQYVEAAFAAQSLYFKNLAAQPVE